MARELDPLAVDLAVRSFGLPTSLHVPIAARDLRALERYVGVVDLVIGRGFPVKAVCLQVPRPEALDPELPIWGLNQSARLHAVRQLWVHVDYTRYRKAYAAAFPEENLAGAVIDHVMNRQTARLKGFQFIRVVAICRGANSSSGALSEKWGIALQLSRLARGADPGQGASIQYADLADLVKLLDIKTGGGIQDPVNEAQRLLARG